MRLSTRVLTVISSILFILMTIGCQVPAGSVDTSTQSGVSGDPGAVDTFEQTLADLPVGQSSTGGSVVSDNLEDPFAAIGPAFSGLGFQTHSSGCDPFEDAYGTCL